MLRDVEKRVSSGERLWVRLTIRKWLGVVSKKNPAYEMNQKKRDAKTRKN